MTAQGRAPARRCACPWAPSRGLRDFYFPCPMLLTIQFPVADARRFVPGLPPCLDRPDWATQINIERHFVRQFGKVEQRLRGGHVLWHDEWYYASARGALRFVHLGGRRIGQFPRGPAACRGIVPQCAFRRLFCDLTGSVVRLQVGLRASRAAAGRLFTAPGCEALAAQALDLEIRLSGGGEPTKPCRLRDLYNHFPSLYERATFKRPLPPGWDQDGVFVRAGRPILLFEYDAGAISALPTSTRERLIDKALVNGAELAFTWHRSEGTTYPLWFLCADRPDRATVRRLRIGLLRLHAEYQVLRQLMRLFLDDRLGYARGDPASDRFDSYLQRAVGYLSKGEYGGLQLREIQDVIAAESLVASEEVGQLRDILRQVEVRRQVALNTAGYVGKRAVGTFDGPYRARLREALLRHYRSRKELEILVDEALSTNLAAVASDDSNLTVATFELVQWLGSQPAEEAPPVARHGGQQPARGRRIEAAEDRGVRGIISPLPGRDKIPPIWTQLPRE